MHGRESDRPRGPDSSADTRWNRLGAAWVSWAYRRSAWVLCGFVVLAGVAAGFAIHHLRIDADPDTLMSDRLVWRQHALAYRKAFPDQQHSIVAAIDGSPRQVQRTIEALRSSLDSATAPLRLIDTPGFGPFFERNGLLFLSPPELEQRAAALESAQPLLGRLALDPSLAGLMQTLSAVAEKADTDAISRLAPTVDAISRSIDEARNGKATALDWSALDSDPASSSLQRFMLLTPRSRADDIQALQAVRNAIAALPDNAARVRLTGEVPLWADELKAASSGAILSAALSLAMVAGLLFIGLRSVSLVAAALTSLIVGLVLTAGFAAVAVGRLNLISVAFGALFIGLAIDFAVHLLLRVRELVSTGMPVEAAVRVSGHDVGSATVLCALTTAAGFFAFVPTAFEGVAELGLISGAGILIGLMTTLSLLPALLRYVPVSALRAPAATDRKAPWSALTDWPVQHRRIVLGLALALGLVAALALPGLRFDYNPMHLTPVGTESQQVYAELVSGNNSPLTAEILVPDASAAQRMVESLQRLPEVGEVRWLGSFVPEQQDDKLQRIEDLNLTIGAALPATLALRPPNRTRDLAAMNALSNTIATLPAPPPAMTALKASIDHWLRSPAADLQTLHSALLSGLPPLFAQLNAALQAEPVSLQTLPASLRTQWVGRGGEYRIEVRGAENLDIDAALIRFADAVRSIAPDATGVPLDYVGGARTVISAFAEAFTLASAVIALLLLVLLRDWGDALRAATPLALGALLTAGVCAATGLSLNFANIIALPMLLGVGLDNGVHLIWRARHEAGNPLHGSTGRAVLIAVLTTLSSFATLSLSPHRGMASMGLMLMLGLGLMLICSFTVIPALLAPRPRSD